MKKNYLLMIVLMVFVSACNDSENEPSYPEGEDGRGSIVLFSDIDLSSQKREVRTRAEGDADLSGYTLSLNGEEISIPENGVIGNLQAQVYALTLSNFAAEDFEPAFGDVRYEGSTDVTVVAQESVAARITLTQANAGVRFVYDPTLAELGLQDIIPTIETGNGYTVVFTGDDRKNTAYFAPGALTVSLALGGNEVDIAGKSNRSVFVREGQLWEITLAGSLSTRAGGAGVDLAMELVEIDYK